MSSDLADGSTLVRVRGLKASFPSFESGARHTLSEVLHGIDLDARRGETLAIVGESGSGKSVTALSILGLLADAGGVVTAGSVTFGGIELVGARDDDLRKLRGSEIGVVFQDPLSSLNPIHKIGKQLIEVMQIHESRGRVSRRAQGIAVGASPRGNHRARAISLMERVGLPQAESQLNRYPHQLSGGMRQRVMIAMALANNPQLLILDEPTTALDVTIQAQILDLLRSIKDEFKCTMILITHDFGVVAELADRISVMYNGEVVESGTVETIFDTPTHPYTRRLLDSRLSSDSLAKTDRRQADLVTEALPVLRVDDLVAEYKVTVGGKKKAFNAVDGVSVQVGPGKTLGIVGESGCGKSSLVRAIMRLVDPVSGSINVDGNDVTRLRGKQLRTSRRDMQLVFQDPSSSLDPRMSVGRLIAEPMVIQKTVPASQIRPRVRELLELVGLNPDAEHRFPHQFSGGQRQRIGIARALAASPKVLLLDEAVSALDPTVQRQITALLARLQRELGVTYVFISHDLSVVREVSDHVAVMYLGQVIETGDVDSIFTAPTHPYTQALLSAVPIEHPSVRGTRERILLTGDLPSSYDPPSGCRFRTRCWKAQEICATDAPELIDRIGVGHPSACHFPEVQPAMASRPLSPSTSALP